MPAKSSPVACSEWASLFAAEWMRLADGKASHEQLYEQGRTLFRVNGDRAPAEVARVHFDNTPEPEEQVREPEVVYARLAAELGIIKPGDKLDDVQLDFAFGVAEFCAAIGDRYRDDYGSAGDHIRAVLGPI